METKIRKPLRLWPGVVAAALGVLLTVFLPTVAPMPLAMAGGPVGALLILLWWLFLSRAPWAERLGALVLIAVAVLATRPLVHESLANAASSALFYIVAIPVMAFALVAWAAGTRRAGRGPRLAWLIPTLVLAGLAVTAVRLAGVSNTAALDFAWRWTPTAEERLLAEMERDPPRNGSRRAIAPENTTTRPTDTMEPSDATTASSDATATSSDAPTASSEATATSSDLTATSTGAPSTSSDRPLQARRRPRWPGFRGPGRDGVARGVRLGDDWSESPPVELWRRAVGPAWSSFAIDGDRFYTQEQLGEEETVSCYDLQSGAPLWRHADPVRFWEPGSGAGPRATPTLHDGRVYTVGGTGIVNALDADDGSLVWSRNAATDGQKSVPSWGFAGSPLVVGDTLIVAAAGKLISYDLATGELRWIGPKGAGYSSPQLATLDGVEQILILNGPGALSVEPSDGNPLWQYDWPGDSIVQAAVTDDGSVLIAGSGSGMGGEPGLRRVAVARERGDGSVELGTGGWTVEERWTSTGLKPNFSDFVQHRGHAYGFDGAILACIDLADGRRKWKGGRYGNGQLVLLAEQDLLLVLSEKGELALVEASPEQFTERARWKAIDGKTWNHPAVAGDIVLVRNSEEMAAFRVTPAGD